MHPSDTSFTTYTYGSVEYAEVVAYTNVAIMALILYDFLIHFGTEVELIWKKRCNHISVLYLVMRYTGLAFPIICARFYLPKSPDTSCERLYAAQNGIKPILLFAVELVMALRVNALYRSSRITAVFLGILFFAAQVTSIISLVLITQQGEAQGLVEYYSLSPNFCPTLLTKNTELQWMQNMNVACPIAFEVVLLLLSLYRFFDYGWSKRRRRRVYSNDQVFTTLIRDNILYFIMAILCFLMTSHWALPNFSTEQFANNGAAYMAVHDFSLVMLLSWCGPHMILTMLQCGNQETKPSGWDPGTSASTSRHVQFTTIELDDLMIHQEHMQSQTQSGLLS